MSHIFISYSRKDLHFAQKIVDALAANELDTWIDWKSIPKGEDWEQEIYRGIEEADAFLFLLSPDSVISEMCNKEIAHAVVNGKRILPIVIRDTDVKKFLFENAKVEISKRNWIFCREEQDDFKKAIAETRETIHTDYEWLKYHTQLQVKALAWKRTGDNSRLLRGKELREAEEQLARISDDEDPQPNPVQRGFVLASRRHEDVQRRRIIFVLGTLVLLAIIAALVAIVQARQARANQFVAEARTAISQQNYHLAGLLALEAEHLSVGTGQDVLASLPYLGPSIGKVVKAHNGAITGLCWTPDGRLVSSSDNRSLVIWDIDTGYPDLSFGGGTSPYLSIAISPNGLLASGNDQGLIEIWKVDSGEKVTEFLRSSSPVLALAWSQDGWLASGSKNGRVVIWGQDGQQIAEFKEQINEITSLAWGPGGTLASASLDGSVVLWDQSNARKVITPDQTEDKVESLTWVSEDTIAIGFENGEIILWDLVKSKRIAILDEHLGPVTSLTVSESGQIISGSEDGRVLIWNMDTSRPLAIFHEYIQKPVSAITTIMNGRLVSGTADGNLVIWDAETGQVMPTLKGHTESVTAVSWAEDGRLASGSKDGSIKIWQPKDWTVIQTLYGRFKSSDFIDENAILQGIYYDQGVTSIAWSKDNRLATGYSDGRVILWHQEPDMKGDLFYSHDSKIVRVTWSVEGQLATAEEDGQVIVWNIADQEPEVTFQIPKEDLPFVRLIDIAWAPDGKGIIALKEDSLAPHFFELDVQSGELRVVDFDYSSLFGYRINMIAWSEKGGMVAALDDTRRPQYDLELNLDGGMTHVNTFADDTLLWSDFPREARIFGRVHLKAVTAVAWSVDGRRFASGSENGDVVIWDIESGEDVLLPAERVMEDEEGNVLIDEITGENLMGSGHSGRVTDLAWSPDGQLASSSSDGSILIWDDISKIPAIRLDNPGAAITCIDWSSDGQLSAGSADGKTFLWDLRSPKFTSPGGINGQVLDLQPDELLESQPDEEQIVFSDVVDIAWDRNGDLAASLENGMVLVWDGTTYAQKTPIISHGQTMVESLAWSPEGPLTTMADSFPNNIILWDPVTYEPMLRLPGQFGDWGGPLPVLGGVTNLAWSPDGELISATEQGLTLFWNITEKKLDRWLTSREYGGNRSSEGFQIAVSPANLLASSGFQGMIEIWNLETGDRLKRLPDSRAGVTGLTWSPDNRLTVSYGNGRIFVWDEDLSYPEAILLGHEGSVQEVAWSRDGYLASAGEDTFVRILPPSLTVPACDWLARNFSQQEWEQYFASRLQSNFGIDLVFVPGYKKICSNLPLPVGAISHFSVTGESLSLLIFILSLVIFMSGIILFVVYKRRSRSRVILSSTAKE